MKKTTLFSLFATALVATLAGQAKATTLYSTDFNAPTYTDGGLIGQDAWLITGTSVVNPIAVANTATNGNVTLATTGQDVFRSFLPSAVISGSVFMSADINVASANATGDYFIHLGDGTTTDFYARTYVKSSGTGYVMALGSSSGAPTLAQYGTTVLSFGTTYHMVAEYDFVGSGTTNDTANLFINPTDPILGGDNLYVAGVTTGTDATTISSVNLRQGSTGPVVTVDNVAVATVVPEPASFVLCGLGIVGLIGFARRKSG
jgi:hypothetical protein